MVVTEATSLENVRKEFSMKNRLIIAVLFVAMLFMMCSCSDPDKDAKHEVETVLTNYQEAINRGDYDAADSYCILEDGKKGSWIFREYPIEITNDTPAYVTACIELSNEQFFIDIYNVDVDEDIAIVETCFYQCSTKDALEELPAHFEPEAFKDKNPDECKEMLKDYIHSYTFMFAANVQCKKINNEWKIVKIG